MSLLYFMFLHVDIGLQIYLLKMGVHQRFQKDLGMRSQLLREA